MTPTEQSVELFKRAGQPAELHLFSDADHFLFAEDNARVWGVMRDWLGQVFPGRATRHDRRRYGSLRRRRWPTLLSAGPPSSRLDRFG